MRLQLPLLIFDLDGTLVDSEILNAKAIMDFLPEVKDSAEDLVERYRGFRLIETLNDLSARHGIDVPPNYLDLQRSAVEKRYLGELHAFEGVQQVLASLPHEKCVASNARREKIALALDVTGLAPYFAGQLFSAYDVQSWKPSPDVFLAAARKMGRDADDCIVIEDSDTGIRAAWAAGMRVIQHVPSDGASPVAGVPGFSHYRELARLLNASF